MSKTPVLAALFATLFLNCGCDERFEQTYQEPRGTQVEQANTATSEQASESETQEVESDVSDNAENGVSSDENMFTVDPDQLAEIESYLSSGTWLCIKVEKGQAGLMRGAQFRFDHGRMYVTAGRTAVQNTYKITGILPNVPNGCKYSALIQVNDNRDLLTWIDDDTMILSWFSDRAKLILRRMQL